MTDVTYLQLALGAGGSGGPPLETRVSAVEKMIEEAPRRIGSAPRGLAADNRDFRKRLADSTIWFSGLAGRVAGVEGRMAALECRPSLVPATWPIITILATSLIGRSGMIFTTSKFLHP